MHLNIQFLTETEMSANPAWITTYCNLPLAYAIQYLHHLPPGANTLSLVCNFAHTMLKMSELLNYVDQELMFDHISEQKESTLEAEELQPKPEDHDRIS